MPTRRDLMTVDLRGLKTPLLARARLQGVSASQVVRQALAPVLLDARDSEPDCARPHGLRTRTSLRLSREEAAELRDRAAAAGVGLGHYVVELMRSTRDLPTRDERSARLAALVQSNAELAALARDVSHLVALLSKGSVRAAQEYFQTLSRLDADVRRHMAQTASVLSSHGKTA